MSKPDINQPGTWKKYHKGMCEGCQAGCCTMPVEVKVSDLLRMGLMTEDEAEHSVKKAARRLEKEGVIRSFRASTGIFILSQNANGDCQYLNKERLCTIYDKRPETCRNFPRVNSRPGYCPASKK